MAATETEVYRTDDPTSGDKFSLYTKDNGRLVQTVALDPEVQGELLSFSATAGTGENTHVAKATPGRLFKVDVLNATAGVLYLMVFDKASAPIDTNVPVLRAYVPASGAASIDLGNYGISLSAGVSVALSTTQGVLTLGGANDGFFQVGYV